MQAALIFLIGLMTTLALAEPVQITLPNKLVGKAEYRKGDPGKAAVVLLHGFLQTHEFPTIHRLMEGIADTGRTTLAPSLTLGVTHRKQSLACEAIHSHALADDLRELDAWIAWLKARHSGPVVLLGHSFGSVELLAYLSERPDPAIRKFVGVSIVEGRLELTEQELDQLIQETRKQAKSGSPTTVTRPFSFCRNYLATPAGLLSYLEWTPKRIIQASQRLAIPGVYIMGGRDDRLGSGWIDRLKRKNRVEVIPGANHFMDGEHEFDLLDAVLKELNPT